MVNVPYLYRIAEQEPVNKPEREPKSNTLQEFYFELLDKLLT